MSDFDLESKLKNVPVPERPEAYWNEFPASVRMQLRRERRASAPRSVWRPRLAWAGGFAVALVLAFACVQFHPLKTASVALTQNEHHLRVQLAQLDTGLHRLMFNPHGMGYLLAEAN